MDVSQQFLLSNTNVQKKDDQKEQTQIQQPIPPMPVPVDMTDPNMTAGLLQPQMFWNPAMNMGIPQQMYDPNQFPGGNPFY